MNEATAWRSNRIQVAGGSIRWIAADQSKIRPTDFGDGLVQLETIVQRR
jgi:hypothetical protein